MKLEIAFLQKALPYGSIILNGKRSDIIEKLTELPFKERECTVSIDTRTILPGEAFFALAGENVDGHNFLSKAIERGVSILFVQEDRLAVLKNIPQKDTIIFVVPDTLKALIDLARVWRQRFQYPVVGITGSVGKTTTKEMLRSIFKAAGVSACVSFKNQNTLIGISLNILRMRDEDEVAVFEVGISQRNEMEAKVDLLRPTIGVVTAIAHAHMSGLGSLRDIAKEKRKIFTFFGPENIGVIYGDHPLLGTSSYSHPVVRFGIKTKNHVQARKISTGQDDEGNGYVSFLLKLYKKSKRVLLKIDHKAHVKNALAATAVANLVGVDFLKITEGLESFDGFEERFEKRKLKKGCGVLISDCYNANPESMRAALFAIHEMKVAGEKIAVLGDMLELGEKELFWHRQVGRALSKTPSINHVILVGERAKVMKKIAPISMVVDCVSNWAEAAAKLEAKLNAPQSLVLVKASHGMELHFLVDQMSE